MSTPLISTRETDVLVLLGQHLSNAEIAVRLSISVRTVESHVSSLLRKLAQPDRRALSRHALGREPGASDRPAPGRLPSVLRPDGRPASGRPVAERPGPLLPVPLTAFVGRARERADLAAAMTAHRQLTVLGPGGVGKTRLALEVAADVAGEFPDGVWFVDLVPVTEPDRVAAEVAATLGVAEEPGRDIDLSLLESLADRRVLLVLDNCEQVRDGVAPFLERLLTACPGLRVLATSRSRLLVPFERVFPVAPLSREGGWGSDAVALFTARAGGLGLPPGPAELDGVVDICERLDGMALAIELAAARWPTLGLDGLGAGLSDQLRFLAGGPRADDRHRSVRAVLDWSHELLEPVDRALLRRVSVFVLPFTAGAAVEVAGFAPLDPVAVADGLGRLAEQSLLTAVPSAHGTRYRALETIRQYGAERLNEAGESADVRSRHLGWCLDGAHELVRTADEDGRAGFDVLADELRSALAWAAGRPERRADARRLALALAGAAFERNLLGESQQRYEQAAVLAADGTDAAEALRRAAAVAGCRRLGDEMYRLHRAAAAAALDAGHRAAAGRDLATAATVAVRFAGEFEQAPPAEVMDALLAEARSLSDDSPAGGAALALAEVAVHGDAFGTAPVGPADSCASVPLAAASVTSASTAAVPAPDVVARAERAVALARRAGDPVAESAALDALAGAWSRGGDAFAAAAATRRRIDLLRTLPQAPAVTHELLDALATGIGNGFGVGDLEWAGRCAGQLAEHRLLVEAGACARSWLLVADVLAGRVEKALETGDHLLETWERIGFQRSFSLGPAAAAVAMVHGLRGDHEARATWLALAGRAGTPKHSHGYEAVFDAVVLLHHGRPDAALGRLAARPGEAGTPVSSFWLHWSVVLRAEASVLAGRPGAREQLDAARVAVAGNAAATAHVDRAEALADGDRERLLAVVAAFEAADCPYQAALTLVLAGGDHTAAGERALAGLGFAPPGTDGLRLP
ncbi:LuxR C-terminal-related transcriptional regulator [Streptomyces racemochromogenes]|uniref:LuxR C-terminal-related transcriptional regulator n=1 Tax=Streptomyces racemochromogenes TaxID=67353 RepID=A0ABW7PNY7_9ACTN